MSRVASFAPIVTAEPRVLILGSMPGVASLNAHEYYAMPRNAFWPVMGELFGAGADLAYDERVRRLVNSRVAVWDVLASCVRPGSLDSSIESATVEVNDFAAFFARWRTIQSVFFNGRKAADIYARRVAPEITAEAQMLRYVTLPSTSPAHAALPYADKLSAWSAVRDAAAGQFAGI